MPYIEKDLVCYQLKKRESVDSQPRAIRRARRIVEEFPESDMRPVGKWIDHQNGRWVYAKCSKCETVHDVKSNYCPNCGAEMKG